MAGHGKWTRIEVACSYWTWGYSSQLCDRLPEGRLVKEFFEVVHWSHRTIRRLNVCKDHWSCWGPVPRSGWSLFDGHEGHAISKMCILYIFIYKYWVNIASQCFNVSLKLKLIQLFHIVITETDHSWCTSTSWKTGIFTYPLEKRNMTSENPHCSIGNANLHGGFSVAIQEPFGPLEDFSQRGPQVGVFLGSAPWNWLMWWIGCPFSMSHDMTCMMFSRIKWVKSLVNVSKNPMKPSVSSQVPLSQHFATRPWLRRMSLRILPLSCLHPSCDGQLCMTWRLRQQKTSKKSDDKWKLDQCYSKAWHRKLRVFLAEASLWWSCCEGRIVPPSARKHAGQEDPQWIFGGWKTAPLETSSGILWDVLAEPQWDMRCEGWDDPTSWY